jgi:hypothetical protein
MRRTDTCLGSGLRLFLLTHVPDFEGLNRDVPPFQGGWPDPTLRSGSGDLPQRRFQRNAFFQYIE